MILSARYANEDRTAAVVETDDAGAVALSAIDTPEQWAEMWQALGEPEPYAAPVVPTPRIISVLEFLERFSQEKRIAIRRAARVSDSLADWLDLLMAAQVVDLDDPRTLGGVAAMVDAELLTEAEALAVLD